MTQRLLDSHHHLWDYNAQQYPWITPGSVLAQSYGLRDLNDHSGAYDVVGTIAVQARQSTKESDWLLEQADNDPLCLGVVGWIDLQKQDVEEMVVVFRDEPKFKGVRHVIQDEPDPEFMLRPAFIRGLKALQLTGLRYDILIYEHQLPNTIKMVDACADDQPFVLDHLAKPVIDPSKFDARWAYYITELADRPNVVCKLSGMATEVRGEAWDTETLRPYVDHVLKCFGPERLMFGSDWPVCLLKTGYQRWVATVLDLIGTLSEDEQDAVLYRNAAEFYGV